MFPANSADYEYPEYKTIIDVAGHNVSETVKYSLDDYGIFNSNIQEIIHGVYTSTYHHGPCFRAIAWFHQAQLCHILCIIQYQALQTSLLQLMEHTCYTPILLITNTLNIKL